MTTDTPAHASEDPTDREQGVDIPVPRGSRRIGGSRRFHSPGLINAHAHLISDGKPLPAVMTREMTEHLVATFMPSLVDARPTGMACLPLAKLDPSTTGIDHIVRANAEMIYEEMLAGTRSASRH